MSSSANQDEYRNFYNSHPEICIFSSPWWLDAVAGSENWDVIFVRDKENKIIATFPYVWCKSRFGLKRIGLPPLTQKMGPFIIYPQNISHTKKITYEHEVYNKIIEELPKFDTINVNFGQEYKNWLPFYWNGFNQTTRYSYRINGIKDSAFVLRNFAQNKRQKVQKAKNLNFKTGLSPDVFYDYFKQVVNERGEKILYSYDLLLKLYSVAKEHNQGEIFYCTDEKENIQAVSFTVWDKEAAYYLSAMRKKEFNTTGGTEFLVYESIKYVSQFVDIFDFEGSMMNGVEAAYRFYGAEQTEYYNISKCNNRLLKIYTGLRGLL